MLPDVFTDKEFHPTALMKGMQEKNLELEFKVNELAELGEARAQAERDYNVAYAAKLLDLKREGVPVTTSKEYARGDRFVADLLHTYRVADTVYEACKKKIYSINIAIETYRSMLSWKKTEVEKLSGGHTT